MACNLDPFELLGLVRVWAQGRSIFRISDMMHLNNFTYFQARCAMQELAGKLENSTQKWGKRTREGIIFHFEPEEIRQITLMLKDQGFKIEAEADKNGKNDNMSGEKNTERLQHMDTTGGN